METWMRLIIEKRHGGNDQSTKQYIFGGTNFKVKDDAKFKSRVVAFHTPENNEVFP